MELQNVAPNIIIIVKIKNKERRTMGIIVKDLSPETYELELLGFDDLYGRVIITRGWR